jgi:WD40 repeat protein
VFTPDGTLALSASGRTSLSLWTVGSGREVREFRGFEGVACLAVSPDGRLAAAGFRNGDIRLFRLPGGEEVRTFDVRQRLEPSAVMVSAIAFTRDGRRLLVNIGGLKLWDCETGETFGFFTGPTDQRLLAVSPDGRWAVSTRYDGPMVPPYALVLWDVSAGREVGQFVGHTRFVISAAFTADGQGLVSGGEDGTIRRWDLTSGQSLRSYLVGGKPLAFTSDGGLALVAGGCGIITLWDADQGKFLRLLEAPAYGYPNPGCESDRKSVLNMIQNILRTADVARRRNAAEDLGKLGLEAIPALNTALADADASVRQEAAAALRRLGR